MELGSEGTPAADPASLLAGLAEALRAAADAGLPGELVDRIRAEALDVLGGGSRAGPPGPAEQAGPPQHAPREGLEGRRLWRGRRGWQRQILPGARNEEPF